MFLGCNAGMLNNRRSKSATQFPPSPCCSIRLQGRGVQFRRHGQSLLLMQTAADTMCRSSVRSTVRGSETYNRVACAKWARTSRQCPGSSFGSSFQATMPGGPGRGIGHLQRAGAKSCRVGIQTSFKPDLHRAKMHELMAAWQASLLMVTRCPAQLCKWIP